MANKLGGVPVTPHVITPDPVKYSGVYSAFSKCFPKAKTVELKEPTNSAGIYMLYITGKDGINVGVKVTKNELLAIEKSGALPSNVDAQISNQMSSYIKKAAPDGPIPTGAFPIHNLYQQPYPSPPAPQVIVPNPAEQQWFKFIADQYFKGADTVILTPNVGEDTYTLALKYFSGGVINVDLSQFDLHAMQTTGKVPDFILSIIKGKLNAAGIKTAPDWNVPAPSVYKKYATEAGYNASFEATSLGTVMEWWANRSDIAVSRTSDGFWQVFSLSLHAIGQHWVIRGDNPAEALRKAVFYNFPNEDRYDQYLKDRVGKGPSW